MKRSTVEVWKPVVGYEGLYEVSSWGRVRSLDRVVEKSNGTTYTVRGRIMRTPPGKHGYPEVRLYRNRSGRTFKIHALVAAAFIGPRPDGYVVMHGDDNPANNHLSNLSYGTQAENIRQCVERGRHHFKSKTHCPAGHEYAGDNIFHRPGGGRDCRQCARDSDRRWRERQKVRKP